MTPAHPVLHHFRPRALASGFAASVAFAGVMLSASSSHRPPSSAPGATRSPLTPALPGEARVMAPVCLPIAPAASVAQAHPIPIRTVPCAAVEAVVARLVAESVVERPVLPASP